MMKVGEYSSQPVHSMEKEGYAHMFYKAVRSPDVHHLGEADLRDHSAEFPTRRRNTMSSGPVTSGKCLPGNDESRRVRAEVEKEVGEAVQEDKRLFRGFLGYELS